MGFLSTSDDVGSLGRAEVRDIFSMASDAWVRSYLLSSDPYEEARLLMEPVQSMHTLSGEHVFTVNKSVTGCDNPKVTSQWLLMPAYNRDTKAAGLFISNRCDESGEIGEPHFVRFVRDDITGEVLYITEIAGANSIEVMHTKLHGPTKRTATYLRFDAGRFRRVFSSDKNNALGITDALVTSCTITETRDCPVCSAASMRCRCSLALQPAAHGLDFRFYRRNSCHMFGTFSGNMNLSTYAAGQERSSQMYRVENDTKCTSSSLTAQLLRGAVQNRIQLLVPNPRNVTLSGSSSANIPPSLAITGPVNSDNSHTWIAKLKSVSAPPFRQQLQPYPVVESNFLPHASAASELANTVDALMDGSVVVLSEQPSVAVNSGCPSPPHVFSDVSSSTPPLSFQSSSSKNVPSIQSSTVLAPRGATTLLPRADPGSGLSGSDLIADKAMMRKIRKREAAERSNTRRHLKRVELKRALRDIRDREAVLRKRKAALEEERLQLQVRLDAAVLSIETEGANEEFFVPSLMSPGTSLRSLSEILNCA